MQDIEQNMEELFRKAAADYPLKVDEGQWDDIAPLIVQDQLNTVVVKKTVSKKYIGFILLFLSLLLSDGIITTTFQNNKVQQSIQSPADSKTAAPGIANEAANYTNNNNSENKLQKHFADQLPFQSVTKYSSLKKESIKIQTTRNEAFENKSDQSPENIPVNPNPLTKITTETSISITPVIKQETIAESNKAEPGKDNTSQKENQVATENTSVKKITSRQPGIYLGAVAGPLFDEVKKQGLKKTGFSVGIIAGYQFKSHLSVETGLLYAKKPYFSTGKYFSMDKISNSMPTGMQILSLEGNNYVWEIPLRAKYDFLRRKKSNFFSTAGITSYILTHEKNNYLVSMNGAQQTMISSYKNKSRSLAATLDISAGYEHKIGKTNHFRIEPYIQIPLKGMGVGAMPMISSGLRVGITKFTR